MVKKIKPRFILTKLGQKWFRKFPSYSNQIFVRNIFRKWCVEEELITSTTEGFQMFVSPHDYASYGIFFFGNYDPLMTNFMKANIPEGGICLDIGAERGWFSLVMGKLVGPNGRVDAFEPFPLNYEKLKLNVALNKFIWVHPHNLALSNKNGKAYFVLPSNEVTHHISYLEDCSGVGYLIPNAQKENIEVMSTTVDEHAEKMRIKHLDFIKIDVEGAEVTVLQGAQRIISKLHPKIAIEYNRQALRRAGTSIEELDNVLNNFGYKRFTFFGMLKRLRLEEWKDRPDDEVIFNVYCIASL